MPLMRHIFEPGAATRAAATGLLEKDHFLIEAFQK